MFKYTGNSLRDLSSVLDKLKLTGKGEAWENDWEQSGEDYPETLSFLETDFIRDTCRWLGISESLTEAIMRARTMFEENDALQRILWHCHYILFRSDVPKYDAIASWPAIPRSVSKTADMFYAFVFFSGIPAMRKLHQNRNIPEQITLDTLSDFELWETQHYQKTGEYGLNKLYWLIWHLTGNLFKLGRLQFQFHKCSFDIHAFRNYKNNKVIVLAPGAILSDDKAVGNPISPRAEVLPGKVTLPGSEWKLILKKGDPVLAVHIPATGPMTHSACGESFEEAKRFFPKYFPEFDFHAFTCSSWLLDPQLEDYLSESSNIVRFLREFYLIPVPTADDTQTFERVFGQKYDNIDDAPQNTSLQRAIVKHCKAGGTWRSGGMVFFPDDLDWGSKVYRSYPFRHPELVSGSQIEMLKQVQHDRKKK